MGWGLKKTSLWDVYEYRIVDVYMGKSLGQIGEGYEDGQGRHEEGVSRVAHLAFGLHLRCSVYD